MIARMKNASLCMAGSNPLVISMRIAMVKSVCGSNHNKSHPNIMASPNRTAAKIRNISLVSKRMVQNTYDYSTLK